MLLKLSYIALSLLTLLFLIGIGFRAINSTSQNTRRPKYILVLTLILWHMYIASLGSSNLLKSYDFPPRFALAFVMPSFIFTGIFLYKHRNRLWINSIPQAWIIYFQSFRILVEILFVFALAEGIFNYQVTIEGYNFDIVFACTAPVMAFLIYRKKLLSKKLLIYWNYLGLLILASVIFLFMASLYTPGLFGSPSPLLPLEAMTYPYVLIAGFLMPTAVFLHVLSIMQLQKS